MHSRASNLKKQIHYSLVFLLSLFLSACGGSNQLPSPEALTDTTPPNVDFFTPSAESSENFEVDEDVEITFSELMNRESLIAEGGIKLFSGSEDVNSEIVAEERAFRHEFDIVPLTIEDPVSGSDKVIPATKVFLNHASGRFALNTDYFFRVEPPARDIREDDLSTEEDERNFLDSISSVSFFTEKGDWKKNDANNVVISQVPSVSVTEPNTSNPIITEQNSDQFSPKLLSNAKGDTFLVWRQEVSSGINQLWASRYDVNIKKWTLLNSTDSFCEAGICANAQLISANATTTITEFDASLNEQGQLVVVWAQASFPGEFSSIWSRIFDGKNWQDTLVEISSTGISSQKLGHADSPKVALDKEGNAVSVWRESVNQFSRIKSNTFDSFQSQWVEAPIFLDGPNNAQQSSINPQLALNANGFSLVLWQQAIADDFHIYSNYLNLSSGEDWLTEAKQVDKATGSSSRPSLAIDENNDAIAVWLNFDGQRNNVWFNRFTGAWNQADLLERSREGDASFANVIIGKNSKAMAYWVQEDRIQNTSTLYASFSTVFTDWQVEEETLASSPDLSNPDANFDREGNAFIVWQESAEASDILVRYYSKRNDNWEVETRLGLGTDPKISPLFEDGRFLANWVDANKRLQTALFSD